MISQGIPMILGGDEFLRTQRGNNNAYCQDNDIGYFDWSQAKANQDLLEDETASPLPGRIYQAVAPQSVVILVCKQTEL